MSRFPNNPIFKAKVVGGKFYMGNFLRGVRPFQNPTMKVVVNNRITTTHNGSTGFNNCPVNVDKNHQKSSTGQPQVSVLVKRLKMADKILSQALSVGLNVTYDNETLGDGNCFYHAVIECLIAQEIRNEFNNDSYLLRQKVVDYVDSNRHLNFVQNFIASVVQVENLSFSSLLLEQRKSGTHAIELFVKATAMFLNIPILVVMERSTRSWPYSIYWPQDAGEVHSSMTMEGYTGNFIIIGNSETDDHFQSLRFVGKLPWDNYETSSQDIDFQVERCVVTSDVV